MRVLLLSHHHSPIAAVYPQITAAIQAITMTKLCTAVSLKASTTSNGSASQYQSPTPTPLPSRHSQHASGMPIVPAD